MPGRLIQTAAQNRDRQVPDPDWIGNLVNPSKIREQRKQAELGVPHTKYKLGGPNQKYLLHLTEYHPVVLLELWRLVLKLMQTLKMQERPSEQ